MAPNWLMKKAHRVTPVVVKMENPNNWSMVELKVPSEEDFLNDAVSSNKRRAHNKNARQLTWVLLLKAHRAAGCITSIASTTSPLLMRSPACNIRPDRYRNRHRNPR
ncbi:unnamed protein product [Lactuca saligna]|uniref:Uncharacterized protein n=1 Tax=Lactuca saligna TaxID=75948 RepID=A0AA35UTA7_LACSI|nr:unnamed protein product [Lactuca saligna]